MSDQISLEEYKSQVDQIGQQLLDIIAMVSMGQLDINVEIPEGIEVFTDIGIGLDFMVEDLKLLHREQQLAKEELEQRVQQRTRDLEKTLNELQTAQQKLTHDNWQEYVDAQSQSDQPTATGYIQENDAITPTNTLTPLAGLSQAMRSKKSSLQANGDNEQTLSIPIKLQDEVIGVVGFKNKAETKWDEQQVQTVEQIIEQVGLALENQRLFDQTQSALAETDTLYQAAAELNTAQDYKSILEAFRKFSLIGQQATTLSLNYFSSPFTRTKLPEWSNVLAQIPALSENAPNRFPFEDSNIIGTLIQANEPTVIPDIDLNTEFIANTSAYTTYKNLFKARGLIFFPLVVANRWVGFINAMYSEPINFSETQVRRATAIATQASVATQNLRSLELAEQRAIESQKRSDELALVNRIVSTVAASFDLTRSLDFVAKELRRAVPKFDEVGIALLNEDKSNLEVIADSFKEKTKTSTVGLIIPLEGNVETQQVISTKQPLVVNYEGQMDSNVTQELLSNRDYKKMIIFPLIAGNDVIGTVGGAIYTSDISVDADEMRLSETILLQASTAIQNTRLFNQTQTALTETTSLYQANAELNAVQSSNEVLNVLRRYTVLGDEANIITINLFDEPWVGSNIPQSGHRIADWAGTTTTFPPLAAGLLSSYPNVENILSKDNVVVLNDFDSYPEFKIAIEKAFPPEVFSAKAMIGVPLRIAGQCIGQIFSLFPKKLNLREDDKRRLLALAGQATVAIQSIRLLEETQKRANQLETAAEIARESSGTLDLDTLLDKSVNLIRDRFSFYHASIFLLEGSEAVVRASTGEAGRQLVANRHSLPMAENRSIIGHVTYSGEPLLVNDVQEDATFRPHALLPETRGELGIPLKIGNRVTGALDVQSNTPNAFTEEDITVLQILADQIAVAVDNARSFEVAQQAVEEMREIDRVKSEFLANMSHELRTPLNSIIGFSRVILKGIDGPINDLQKQDLDSIHNSGQHLLDMINDILDLSRIEANKMDLTIEEIELKETIDSVMSTVKGLVKEKPIKLVANQPEILPTVKADRTRARQVLINLFSNAVKFTEEGEITLTIEVREATGNIATPHVYIGVTDTGIGITPEDQAFLFERFSQVDASPTRKAGGTGLGLNISRSLVELMGGTMGVTSDEGKGSTFYFTLPVAGQSKQEDDEEIGGRIVLSIEEDQKVIDVYKKYLKPHGFRVIVPQEFDAAEIVNQVKQTTPFVITVDVMAFGGKGWEILEALKKDPETKQIPVVVCSILEERERAKELGADDYLIKPMQEPDLINSISRLSFRSTIDTQRILLVDDDPNIMHLVEKATRKDRTLTLEYAAGGIKGLAQLKEKRPDAMILDLFMPDLDGFSILETLHKDPDMKSIPVVVLTGAELTESEKRRLEKYQRALLFKGSFKADELIESLERAIHPTDKLP